MDKGFIVYILFSEKFSKTYVGYTRNLRQRLLCHNAGKVVATMPCRPRKIIYQELVASLAEAKKREHYWKTGAGRRNIAKVFLGSRPTFF
jgi:putative endonuclease